MNDYIKDESNELSEMSRSLLSVINKFNDLAAEMQNPEQFRTISKGHLGRIDRKTFLKAIKSGQKYINDKGDVKKLSDSKKAAYFWLTNQITPEIMALKRMPKEDQAELESFLKTLIDNKVVEIVRTRKTKGTGEKVKTPLTGKSLNMFSNKVTTAILTTNKNSYTAKTETGEYIAPFDSSLDIIAKEINGTLEELDTKANLTCIMLLCKLTEQIINSQELNDDALTVELTLKEYMNLRGQNSEAAARESLKHAQDQLICAYVSNKAVSGTVEKDFYNIVERTTRYKNGMLRVVFTKTAATEIKKSCPIKLSRNIFLIDLKKDSNAFYIAQKLSWHYGFNSMRKKKGQDAPNPNTISVRALLNCCNIPKYDDIKGTGHINRAIISPFKSALQTIELTPNNPKGLINYEYTHAKEEPLSQEELNRLENGQFTYDEFISLYIKFNFIDQPKEINI